VLSLAITNDKGYRIMKLSTQIELFWMAHYLLQNADGFKRNCWG